MTGRIRRWDECSGDPCICPKPAAPLVRPLPVARCIADAIGDDDNPGLTGEALDAWNAATARAINIARNWKA